MKRLLFLFSLVWSCYVVATPPWATSISNSIGSTNFKAVCSGDGPSIDIARKVALNSCRQQAVDQLKTHLNIKSKSVETETQVGFHQEVSSNEHFENLNCNPLKQEMEEIDGFMRVWLLCKFDLRKVTVKESEVQIKAKEKSESGVANSSELISQRTLPDINSPRSLTSENSVLSISVIPACRNILVEGESPRVVTCDSNPVEVILFSGDSGLIVRADGFEPKTIKLNSSREQYEQTQVILNSLEKGR